MNKYVAEPEGKVKGGNPGAIIFNEKGDSSLDYFKNIPGPFKPEIEKLLVVPVYLIFGSEELSSSARSVSELVPEPFLLLNDKETKRLNIALDNIINITVNKVNINVNIKTDNMIPDGIAGLSVTHQTLHLNLPDWGIIKQDESD
jgi:NADH-quinone oxidoreductase subunit G